MFPVQMKMEMKKRKKTKREKRKKEKEKRERRGEREKGKKGKRKKEKGKRKKEKGKRKKEKGKSICAVCKGHVESIFARYPNGVITHLHCAKDRHICPVTGTDFRLTTN